MIADEGRQFQRMRNEQRRRERMTGERALSLASGKDCGEMVAHCHLASSLPVAVQILR